MSQRTIPFVIAALVTLSGAPAFAAGAQPTPVPGGPQTPAEPTPKPSASPVASENAIVNIGTTAVFAIRQPQGSISAKDRAAVIQSRVNQVLLHHPYLTWADVKVLRVGPTPVVYWGPFAIVSADAEHARLNNFSSPDVLAHAWANNLRAALKKFISEKKMPERALYRNERGSDFVYRRTERTLAEPTQLKNTRYIFSPDDLEYGAGIREAGQHGFVIFAKKDAGMPPEAVYLGNAEGTFTEYDLIRPEETP